MDDVFTLSTKTGEIVTRAPEASLLLSQYKIDFCCGGNRPIGEAITERNLNGEEILKELNNVYFKSLENVHVNWDEKSNEELVNHIITTHHDYLREVLPELLKYTEKILHVHGHDSKELKDVFELFCDLKAELEEHTIDEEENVFPLIIAFEKGQNNQLTTQLTEKIGELEDEHQAAGDILRQLREITKDYVLPEWACTTYQLTFQKLEDLESDLFEHIHLENNILFPRVLRALNSVQ